ncbi:MULTISPECIES: hypothetical protein [Streptomyces]|uniref:Uncharacterized protein n=2 Tax=Streptomyces TaxID=1883 RepID=A0ABD5EUZ3_9ACTN|nr:hypothetical protein [Streptomyces sp. DSM 41981]MDT0438460.1 hypothetical protein [Streptomyces sp. DSM 41981]
MTGRPRGRAARRGRGGGIVVLAGWLFADLLLVLALVSMADRPDPLAARAGPSPGASASGAPSASPSPSPTGPRGVSRTPRQFRVHGSDKGDLVRQIRAGTEPWRGDTAALVLTFGGGGSGTVYAHLVNGQLAKARPEMFGPRMATDDYHDLSEGAETALIRVYFYTRPGG